MEVENLDDVFSNLLGEMELLTQSLGPSADPSEKTSISQRDNFSIGFTDLDESPKELEDQDLDTLVADLGSESSTPEPLTSFTDIQNAPSTTLGPVWVDTHSPQTNTAEPTRVLQTSKPQMREDKIKLAPKKLKEANVKKMIVKVLMNDGGSKTLMVDERQTVRDVLDSLFEKTHCDPTVDWSLCETNPELQIERGFEDHEYLVEHLSAWTSNSKNSICFVSRPEKYRIFKEPQVFYMWKNSKMFLNEVNEQAKGLLLKESFEGQSLMVPDLEGVLFLKEDGKKTWRHRYFLLRASGLYYVPKGKSKSSSDLACFIQFDKVNIYTTTDYKQRYRAPTDFCFILKHACIQKESDYIKFLCCENEHTLSLWVNAIRVAKYGTTLYRNYWVAVKRNSRLSSALPLSGQPASRPLTPSKQEVTVPPIRPASSLSERQQISAPFSATQHEDDLLELLPDFIPPPPPGHSNF